MSRFQRGLAVAIILLVVYAVYYAYLGPRLVGDNFALSLVNFDQQGMRDRLCSDANVLEVLAAAGTTDDQTTLLFLRLIVELAPQELADVVNENLHANTRYDLLTGEYRFSLMLGTDIQFLGMRFPSGFTTPEFRLNIRRGWLLPCVLAA
jgi:hypothetical protein